MPSHSMTRRAVLGAAAATAGAVGLGACAGDSGVSVEAGDATTSAAVTPAPSTPAPAPSAPASTAASSTAAAPAPSESSPASESPSAEPAAPALSLVALADVPVGGAVAAQDATGKQIIVAQPTKGTVVAFSAICTHNGCAVAPAGAKLNCPCHGSVYDAATGKVLRGPAPRALAAVKVKVQGAQVVSA